MARDCETLSPKARLIFKKLEPHFPPDPWNRPQWIEDGIVIDNGQFDLRKGVDRTKLLQNTRSILGYSIEVVAAVYKKEKGSLEGFEHAPMGKMVQNRMELLMILNDLDFQIETMDLLEE